MDEVDIILRELELDDLEAFLYWNHPSREFHRYNGPYYKKDTLEELNEYVDGLRKKFMNAESDIYPNKKMIVNKHTGDLIGQVNWYWKSEETLWMEIGIVIFNEDYWGRGIGYKGLELWISDLFESSPELVRLGLSTWSGNTRMMKLAEQLGFVKEAVYRKARIVDGNYYDSVSYGILREEWEKGSLHK